jgi:hypothetical protein
MRQAVVVVDAPEQRLAHQFAILDGDNREEGGVVSVGRGVRDSSGSGGIGRQGRESACARVVTFRWRTRCGGGDVVGVTRAQRDVVAAE